MAEQKLCLIICSNRETRLPKKTENLITKKKIKTFFVKQNLPEFYKRHKYIQEIITDSKGSSNARNTGIGFAKNYDIIAFTDDDCIITEKWIDSINKRFQNPQTNIIFGKTFPYQPSKHKGEISVCTFSKNPKSSPIVSFCKHWEQVGFSNNMAIRTKILKKIKGFKPWLGPGSICLNGEDAEFILNAINLGYPIFYEENMIVYHDKWLTQKQLKKQNISYNSGTIGAYGYYAFKGNLFCKNIISEAFFNSIKNTLKSFREIIHPKTFLDDINYQLVNLFFMSRTFVITYFYHLTK